MTQFKAVIASACLALAVGCSSGAELGNARVPTLEGVVSEVGPSAITIEGKGNFEVTAEVAVFATQSLSALPLTELVGRYVHAATNEEGLIVWIASIGIVAGDRVVYNGTFDREVQDRLIFADDTSFAIPSGYESPDKGTDVLIEINVADGTITARNS